jgi:hypothetical protein
MTALVAISLVKNREHRPRSLARRVARVASTLVLVYVTVVIIGRGVQRAVLGQHDPTVTQSAPRSAH